MRHFIPLIILAILTACANTHPIKIVGPDTYKITHVMTTTLPNDGAKNALKKMGEAKCATMDNAPFYKQSEDVKVEGKRQTLTLIFRCQALVYRSNYVPSAAPSTTWPLVPQDLTTSATLPQ